MSTTYAQTIDGNKIYAERSVQDKDGNQIDTTYAKIASLATVATTGDYGDLLNKPTIPAAQVQSDWNESDTTDPSYIQNKPTIPSGSELVPSYSLPTDEGKVLTVGSSTAVWATPSAPNTKPVVAGSNIVITENTNNVTISTTGLQPTLPTISGHAGDVLTVNSQGNAIEWAASQGGTQVQADWAETSTSDPSYIQNKPTMNSLAAGSNISITPSGSTVTVAVTGLATVATSGSYADLSNTPTIPTATSDLTNDAGFITLSDVPAQVNADWNSSSGASEILNKPTIPSGAQLVPTATSADADKVLTVDSQGTPAWSTPAAGGVTDVEVDGTSVVSGGVASITTPTVDQVYNSASTNAQSGTAVAGALAGVNQVPASTSSDEGKVLTVDANGDPEWATGGGSQVQSDWTEDDTTEPSYIQNKPTPKTLTAGTAIAITENASTITISTSYTAGITDIQQVASLPANPVSTVLYLIPEA